MRRKLISLAVSSVIDNRQIKVVPSTPPVTVDSYSGFGRQNTWANFVLIKTSSGIAPQAEYISFTQKTNNSFGYHHEPIA